ncbi:MAG: UDP-N-acetylmuramoyl-L-alanyl-D-glutamate--2,6-diaminopimelate ligase [Anaerolineaceae bacterium]|nr:UDP-N-acetylmuramoyl-L-alanyl-D-glutamate--2,6-diaminopimelate ligase [Anaerolineaceae bacterium]
MTGFVKKTFFELFADIPIEVLSPGTVADVPVTGISSDSRNVHPGNVFIAALGDTYDGHEYIPSAIAQGAAAVVGTREDIECAIPYVRVADSRYAMAHLAAAFYDFPARQMSVIGVTGTDGKTTTSNIIFQILQHAGIRAGMISTVNAVIGDEVLDTGFHVTTPDSTDVQRYLSRMLAAGLTHVVLETTSHGLAQHRVAACEFDIAVVTNITHEHLDYHGSWENYRDAKAILFRELAKTHEKPQGNPRLAVLNKDERSFAYLENISLHSVSYSLERDADLWADQVVFDPKGVSFTAVSSNFEIPVKSQLVGAYNISNCLAAIAVTVVGLSVSPSDVQKGIAAFRGVPGRMERIDFGQDFTAIVDFAHTPNALKNALQAARTMTTGRVIAVFGSAGLRDREKRRLMAEVSIQMADLTIITAEDPRTESLDEILAEMADAARRQGGIKGESFWCVPDRGAAIQKAVSLAQAEDLVISCGKGHEQSMCFGTMEYAWDDRTAMRAALGGYLEIDGPEMPYLPTQDAM